MTQAYSEKGSANADKLNTKTAPSHPLLAALQSLSERSLTIDYLIPLFEALGYEDITYYGGPYEAGKDIVMWRVDGFDFRTLTVVQVKKFRFTARSSSDSNSLTSVLNQLSNAATEPVAYTDGKHYLPSEVLFVSPYPISLRALHDNFRNYSNLEPRNCKIVDGPRLARLLQNRCPQLIPLLGGEPFKIEGAVSSTLNNEDLMRALDFRHGRAITDFYCDVHFAPGSVLTRFLSASRRPKNEKIALKPEQILDLLQIETSKLMKRFAAGVIAERKRSREALKKMAAANLKAARSQLEIQDGLRNDIITHRLIIQRAVRCLEKRENTPSDMQKECRSLLDAAQDPVDSKRLKQQIEKLSKVHSNHGQTSEEEVRESVAKAISSATDLAALARKLIMLEQRSYSLEVRVDGTPLSKALAKEEKKLEANIAQLKRSKSVERLTQFLEDTHSLFLLVERIMANSAVSSSLGISAAREYSPKIAKMRVEISVSKLFATRLDIALLGDAGVGKTTSLMNYAAERISDESDERIVIFAPLSSLVDSASDYRSQYGAEREESEGPTIEECLCEYLRSLGIQVEREFLRTELLRRPSLILLDAIDECYRKAPWILPALSEFKKMYASAQVITSSRLAPTLVDRIPFVHVTLLPFTKRQRDKFFRHWFPGDSQRPRKIRAHLLKHGDLDAVVRNPLSATILCVLAENNVRLPTSEVKLYEKRFQLLTGQLDKSRGVYRFESDSEILLSIARYLAFMMHLAQRRSMNMEHLEELAVEGFQHVLSKDACRLAVQELIHPGEVLVPMNRKGELGFGHLRFQEFLASEEIRFNRSIEIRKLLSQVWWNDCLVMLSQQSASIEFLINLAFHQGIVEQAVACLSKMIQVRPSEDRARLTRLVARKVARAQQDERDFLFDSADGAEDSFDNADVPYVDESDARLYLEDLTIEGGRLRVRNVDEI